MAISFFAFHPKDWQSDPAIKLLSHKEKGMMFDLLCNMWILSDDCSLPDDDKFLSRLLHITLKQFQQVKESFFNQSAPIFFRENGKIFCKKLNEERKKSLELSRKNSEKGLKSSEKRLKSSEGTRSKPLELLGDDSDSVEVRLVPEVNQRLGDLDLDLDLDKDLDKIKKEPKPFLSDSIEVRLSELLLNLIRQRNPNHKQPNIQSWANIINLMIRRDKRPHEEIERVIQWCQTDSFWKDNILSTLKLREKYDQLFLKMDQTKTIPPTDWRQDPRFKGML